MEEKNNIIQFPRILTKTSNPLTEEDRNTIITGMREDIAEEISDAVMHSILSQFEAFGLIEDATDISVKDTIFLEETIKANIYRYKGLPHNLHDIIDEVVQFNEDDDVASTTNNEKTEENVLIDN